MVLGELSRNVWEAATVLWPNSRYFKLRRGERINGYSPPLIRTAVRGAWLPSIDGSPVALGLYWGP